MVFPSILENCCGSAHVYLKRNKFDYFDTTVEASTDLEFFLGGGQKFITSIKQEYMKKRKQKQICVILSIA